MAGLGRDTYHRIVVEGNGAGAGRLTAIVLFTDLVGSTELRARLGVAGVIEATSDAVVAAVRIQGHRSPRVELGASGGAGRDQRWGPGGGMALELPGPALFSGAGSKSASSTATPSRHLVSSLTRIRSTDAKRRLCSS
jgi:hypothetical protein